MNFIDPSGALTDAGVFALVAALVAFLRPAIESLPFAHDTAANKDMHDLTLRAVAFFLNLIGLIYVAWQNGALDLRQMAPTLLLTAAGLTVGSHVVATVIPAAKAAAARRTAARLASANASPAGAAGATGKPASAA